MQFECRFSNNVKYVEGRLHCNTSLGKLEIVISLVKIFHENEEKS